MLSNCIYTNQGAEKVVKYEGDDNTKNMKRDWGNWRSEKKSIP